jgi:peptide/nickel transport system ATP-binding protein
VTVDRGEPLLSVRGLEKHYPVTQGFLKTEVGRVRAVDGVSFDLHPGEAFGIVGESGCGKTTVALTMTRLREPTGGEIRFRGRDVTAFDREELKRFRRSVQVVFQDPNSSFDPRMSVGDAIAEPLVVQGMADAGRRREVVEDLLERVGLSAADAERYPHELSGGQKQRVGLARALAVNPDVIVADEPVSALDVSVKAEILSLMRRLQETHDLTIVVISHDLGVVEEICDRVAVMYLGEFVEVGPTDRLFAEPRHPYTEGLLAAIPSPDPGGRGFGTEIRGDVPDAADPPSGCRFHTRCPAVIQPESVDLDQDVWRRLLDARVAIVDGEVDVTAAAEAYAAGGTLEADGLTVDETAAALRGEFDLPERLSDATAERTLGEALDALARGDPDAAASAFEGTFQTPCASIEPRLQPVEADHTVSCHLRHPPAGVDVPEEPSAGEGVAAEDPSALGE